MKSYTLSKLPLDGKKVEATSHLEPAVSAPTAPTTSSAHSEPAVSGQRDSTTAEVQRDLYRACDKYKESNGFFDILQKGGGFRTLVIEAFGSFTIGEGFAASEDWFVGVKPILILETLDVMHTINYNYHLAVRSAQKRFWIHMLCITTVRLLHLKDEEAGYLGYSLEEFFHYASGKFNLEIGGQSYVFQDANICGIIEHFMSSDEYAHMSHQDFADFYSLCTVLIRSTPMGSGSLLPEKQGGQHAM